MNDEHCIYETVAPPRGFSPKCDGPIVYESVGGKVRHLFCRTHGVEHLQMNPFGPYRRRRKAKR